MQPAQNTDYRTVISQVIKKQIVILGPDITLAKARNVKGLSIDAQGNVIEISGSPQEVIQELINQFVELSGLIVRKTMEPLLANYPDGVAALSTPTMPASPSVSLGGQVGAPPAMQAPVTTQQMPQPEPANTTTSQTPTQTSQSAPTETTGQGGTGNPTVLNQVPVAGQIKHGY